MYDMSRLFEQSLDNWSLMTERLSGLSFEGRYVCVFEFLTGVRKEGQADQTHSGCPELPVEKG